MTPQCGTSYITNIVFYLLYKKKNSFDVYEKVLYIVDSEPECLQIALSRAVARNKRPHLLTPAAYETGHRNLAWAVRGTTILIDVG